MSFNYVLRLVVSNRIGEANSVTLCKTNLESTTSPSYIKLNPQLETLTGLPSSQIGVARCQRVPLQVLYRQVGQT
jgi:hypothetical protein